MRRAAFWLLFAVTLGVYAAMVGGTLAMIARDAGMPAFDMRPWGMSEAQARDFLSALSDDGRALYQGPQRWLDAVYPALLALTVIWSARWAAGHWLWVFRLVFAAAVLCMLADYAENIAVAGLLGQSPEDVSAAEIARATLFTRLKAASGAVAMTLWGVLLLRQLGQKLTVPRS
ncbi:hypothetical protein HCZ23_11135 [Celeribacter sp. HF31]|uniref:hypothetical protein n=1 Tax=Celeribacter sp. HF31 TaxID=2721558 RepID=UPI001430F3F4|nr:hypothetical protein [Celeribacter sp. HF31]NIY80019.1 hypothetical protein [Celeribacter sp. HF31]